MTAFELFDLGQVHALHRLLDKFGLPHGGQVHCDFVMGVPGGMPGTADALVAAFAKYEDPPRAYRVDPALLAALIREESRFDPEAVSPAAAHGLTQLTLPTARKLARDLGLERLLPADLRRPELAIALGAAHLAELAQRFPGAEAVVVAAYNAGDDQAALWRRSCLTGEPEEFLAKIGFRETKAYVVRVLESRALYQALYGRPQG